MHATMGRYVELKEAWPDSGRCILAHYDEHDIVVYQAYRPEIGRFAVENQRFGGSFSFNRMSWIKPNFLWMMYRSGWGTKQDQEVTLAIRLKRSAFDSILAQAVHSSYQRDIYESQEQWKSAVSQSSVRLQWDPDHAPSGASLERRAIQIGLRDEVLRQFGTEWITNITDISPFVAEQREIRSTSNLVMPVESVYPVTDPEVRFRLQLDA